MQNSEDRGQKVEGKIDIRYKNYYSAGVLKSKI